MKINGASVLPDVRAEDLVAEAATWGVPADHSRREVARTLDQIVEATRTTPSHASIEKHVPGYIRAQAENLAAGKAARITSAVPLMALPRIGTPQSVEERERSAPSPPG